VRVLRDAARARAAAGGPQDVSFLFPHGYWVLEPSTTGDEYFHRTVPTPNSRGRTRFSTWYGGSGTSPSEGRAGAGRTMNPVGLVLTDWLLFNHGVDPRAPTVVGVTLRWHGAFEASKTTEER
jgi:hypothetical protein